MLEFVENIETVMGNLLARPKHAKPEWRSPHRLGLVQLSLKDGALRWLNGKLQELTDEAEKEGRVLAVRPLNWDVDVRRAFIQAHLGTDTVELWLSKLSSLRLGEGRCLTPIEFDNQFDSIARHVFPNLTADDTSSDLPVGHQVPRHHSRVEAGVVQTTSSSTPARRR